MNDLSWPIIAIVFLGLAILAAGYWFRLKSKSDRSPFEAAGNPAAAVSATRPDSSVTFEQAYRSKLEGIRQRRQQREQARRMAAERTLQSVQLRIQSSERQQLETAASASSIRVSTMRENRMIGTVRKTGEQAEHVHSVNTIISRRYSMDGNGIREPEKLPGKVDFSIAQRKDNDLTYSLGWQQARQLAAETVSGHQDMPPLSDEVDITSLFPENSIVPIPITAASFGSRSKYPSLIPPPVSGRQSELLNDYARYFVLCDNETQIVLLKELINQANLKPDGQLLKGIIRLEPQSKVLSQRVDFLVNEKLAIDIDRHVYRNAKMTVIRDRMRNQSLMLDGYKPMTFSGNQILADPKGIAQIIIATALQITKS